MEFTQQLVAIKAPIYRPVKLAILGIITLSTLAFEAQAVTITTMAEAHNSTFGVLDSNNKTNPPASLMSEAFGPVGSSFDLNFGAQPGYARAAQNEAGKGAVAANGVWGGIGYNGSQSTLTASSSWSNTYTNNTANTQNLNYNFSIDGASLVLGDWAGASGMLASYAIDITLNGTSLFSSGALLEGGSPGHTLTKTGTDLGDAFFDSGAVFGYDFNAYIGTLDLGSLLAGESFTLAYEMTVIASSYGGETGAAASIGDPNSLEGGGRGLSGAIGVNPVPIPAAVWLFGSGLVGLIGFGKRKMAAA